MPHNKYIAVGVLVVLGVAVALFGPTAVRTVKDKMASFSLKVPFTTQAPTGKWENNENCEEASAIMVNAYLTGFTGDQLTASSTQESISILVRWEQDNTGHTANNGVDEIAQMIEEVFQLKTAQLEDFTADDLKNELVQNHVLILPINMNLLGNPEYPKDQKYHVLVIRGYTPAGFLVNDPGLSSGRNNLYSFDTLANATSDWDSTKNELIPRKVVLSVWK